MVELHKLTYMYTKPKKKESTFYLLLLFCDFRCLTKAAGGDSRGKIDFYQMHTYSYKGAYSGSSPMQHKNYAFNLDKPNVIGEYSQDGSDGKDITYLHKWAYTGGYR